MTVSRKIRPRRWIVACGIGLMLISLVLHTGAGIAADQRTDPNVTSSPASSQGVLRNWTSFRGPGGNGRALYANPPLHWSAENGRNILWKAKLPKHGMSSPVIWENRLFLTGADDVTRQVYCFDTDTGKLLWQHDVHGIAGTPPDGKLPDVLEETGFAAPTATTNGRYVAAIFGTGELVCVSMKGQRIWAKHLGIPKNHYGHASSLISHGDLLYVQYDQTEDSQLLALHLASGNLAWQVTRGLVSWSSPILIDNKGRMELVLTNSKAVDSYDPRNGNCLWHVECLAGEVAPSAAYADGVVFVATDGAVASAMDIGTHGSEPKMLWQWDEALPDAASPLANEDYLILPTGFGVVSCLDAKTGKLLWEQEFDSGFYSSPIRVNDRVYITDLSGTTQIFRMGDKFERLGASSIGEDAYATPAFVGDRIYIRGVTHLFCVEE
ncbi:MAG: PQQ-binding-like beta-propeller repeat protein [Planctomycetota bacterium]|nr:PQQ-binding-like beta-propeller repeat protein [Planctomycetota bacterium]